MRIIKSKRITLPDGSCELVALSAPGEGFLVDLEVVE